MILARQYKFSQGFIFSISIGKYEKRALNFAIQAFSTSFCFSKSLNFLKFLDKLEQAKCILKLTFKVNWNKPVKTHI